MTESLRPEDSVLVAEYALGLMGKAEERAFAQRLDAEPLLFKEYELWLENLSPMVSRLPDPTPSAKLKTRVEHHVFGESIPQSTRRSPWWEFLQPKFIGGLLVISLLSLILYRAIPPAFVATHVAELATADQSLAMTAKYDLTAKQLRVSTVTGKPAANRDFELWVIAGDDPPASLGVITTDATQNIAVPEALTQKLIGATLAISDEPLGGSPTGQPTGAVLATAAVGAI